MQRTILPLAVCAVFVFVVTSVGSCEEGIVAGDCFPDCGARVCGPVPNGCGESCGSCGNPESCDLSSGQCEGCTPDCSGRDCGPDPQNCGTSCGTCDLPGQDCNPISGLCDGCSPDCGVRVCGPVPNGCGANCGTCEAPAACDIPSGQCKDCTPDCSGRECGPDPQNCGTSCGTCNLPGQDCNLITGRCQGCSPDCGARVCGPVPNGCGESCGSCNDPDTCDIPSGRCQACTPDCSGRECGPDPLNCGGALACGTCVSPPAAACLSSSVLRTFGAQGTCSAAGQCSYTPQDKTCENGCNQGQCNPCTPESDTDFCRRLGKNCDPVSEKDNCGQDRAVASCGSCSGAETCGGGGTPNVCGSDLEEYTLVWWDDFNDGVLDDSKWTTANWDSGPDFSYTKWRPSQVSESGGDLIITAQPSGSDWLSGYLWSDYQMQPYGILEFRAKWAHANGVRNMMYAWTNTPEWYDMNIEDTVSSATYENGACDQHAAGESSTGYSSNRKNPSPPPDWISSWCIKKSGNLWQEYHVWRMEWTPDGVIFTLDGVTCS